MSERQRCAACGREGYDVSTRIVENPDPAGLTTVKSPNGPYQVPARWVSQLRCMNTEECRDRAELSLGMDEPA